jgi:glutaredoxin
MIFWFTAYTATELQATCLLERGNQSWLKLNCGYCERDDMAINTHSVEYHDEVEQNRIEWRLA